MSMTDGGLLFMDCSSIEEGEDWVQCLNAVLFAKSLKGGESVFCLLVVVETTPCTGDPGVF